MVQRQRFTRLAVGTLGLLGAFLVTGGTLVSGQANGQALRPHSSTQEPSRLVTLDKLKRWEKELSNWGRWGKDDQRGLLNLITPEKTKQATALVMEGTTVTLQINPFKKSGSDTGSFGENVHRMARIDPTTGEVRGALDIIQLSIHDGLSSHMDALCHYQGPIGRRPGEPAVSYNGFPFTLTAAGCRESAADRMGPGYVTRGILVDLPAAQERPMARAEHSDLCGRSRSLGGVRGHHDWRRRRLAHSQRPLGEAGGGRPVGLRSGRRRPSCIRPPVACASGTLSLLASDAVNDVQPSGVQGINRPIHQVTQVNLGLPLVDNAYLEDAAREAERLQRWEFMFTLHIYQIQGGTASPFNALATF